MIRTSFCLFCILRSFSSYLIYNDPLNYADLILNGDPEEYLKNVAGSHGLEDSEKGMPLVT